MANKGQRYISHNVRGADSKMKYIYPSNQLLIIIVS